MHAQVHAQVHAHADGKRGFHHSGNAYLRHGCGFVDIKGRKRYNNQSKGATFLCSAPRTTASLRALKSGSRAAAFPLRSGAPQRPGTLSRRAPPARTRRAAPWFCSYATNCTSRALGPPRPVCSGGGLGAVWLAAGGWWLAVQSDLPLRDAWHSGRLLSITVPTQRDRGKVSPQVAPGFHLPLSFSGFFLPTPCPGSVSCCAQCSLSWGQRWNFCRVSQRPTCSIFPPRVFTVPRFCYSFSLGFSLGDGDFTSVF